MPNNFSNSKIGCTFTADFKNAVLSAINFVSKQETNKLINL